MGFGFKNIEHAFAYAAQEMVKGAKIVGAATAHLQAVEPVVETVTAAVDPPAVLIERAAFALVGSAAKAASDLGDASQAKGLNLQLDAQSIQDLQLIAKYLRGHLAAVGATLATTAAVATPAPTAAAARAAP